MMEQLASNGYALGVSSNSGTPSDLLDSMDSCKTANASDELWDDLEVLRASTLPPLPPRSDQ